MASVSLAPAFRQQYFDANGNPLAGGKVYTYQSGTSTPQATYTDSTGATPNANPTILDASGVCNMWFDITLSYKVVVKDSSDVQVDYRDGMIGIISNNAVATASLQDGSVTTAKLADGAVTSVKLASDASIDANRPVNTNNIRDGAVTIAKMDTTNLSYTREIRNAALTASVGSNILTVALKTKALADATSTTPVAISFRNSSLTTGDYVVRSVTAALSIATPSSGATLGATNGNAKYLFVYAIDNAGTVELALAGSSDFDEGILYSTTAMSSSATSSLVLYSTVTRSNVAVRLIGRVKVSEATAGTYASSPSEVSLAPFFRKGYRSEIYVDTGNGHGSTNNKIRRFSNTVISNGTDLTFADSATLGSSITVNTPGTYLITLGGNNESTMGLSVNTSAPTTTSNNSLTYAQGYRGSIGVAAGTPCILTRRLQLEAGDVLRAHGDGGATGTTFMAFFHVMRDGD